MRISDLALALMLAGALSACGSASESESPQEILFKAKAEHRGVSCRVGKASDFDDVCMLERRGTDAAGRTLVILRHGDGGFRRLIVSAGDEIGQADGSEPIRLIAQDKDRIEIAIGADHYRLRAAQLKQPTS